MSRNHPNAGPASKTSNSSANDERDIDRGWAWTILTVSFLTMVIFGGQQYGFGNYYVPFLNHFGESRSKTSLAGGFQACVFQITGPVCSNLLHLIGSRMLAILGGLLMATGFALLYFAQSMLYITFVYGILVGIGSCFTIVGIMASMTRYFKRHIFIASGITFAGVGVGFLTLGLTTEYLIVAYGWRGSFLIQSGISLQVCVFSAFVFNQNKRNAKQISDDNIQTPKNAPTFKEYLRDFRFWSLSISVLLYNLGCIPIFMFLKDLLLQKNLDIYPIIIVTIGSGSTIGRFSAGFISNHINPMLFYFYVSFVNMVSIAALSLTNTLISLGIVGFVFGLCHGYAAVLQSLKLIAVYGKEESPKLWGYGIGYGAVGVLIGPPLFGYFKDKTGVYNGSIAMCSAAVCLAGLFALVVFVIEHKKKLNRLAPSEVTTSIEHSKPV